MIELVLPWPPSANTYWRHPNRGPLAGRHLISRAGRSYRADVARIVGCARPRGAPLAGRLAVALTAAPPDRRRRDLDNLLKAVQDALSHAGVWDDDEQIDWLTIERVCPRAAGRVDIEIREIKETSA